MARMLASIQRISEIHPIPEADKIEAAKVLGWHVVVLKDQYKPNDLCVYCEIDSVMPEKPEFEFLRERKFRIRTVKLRKQVSQGICFPLSILPKDTNTEEGTDVTDVLGIQKYIPYIPENLRGKVKGSFPSFMPKTDETRVQVLQSVLTRWKGTQCYVTEKIDGTSVTYYLKDDVFGVCSRNLELEETPENLYWKVARQYRVEDALRSLGYDAALQGEIYGLGVQKNTLRLEELRVGFFNMFLIKDYRYLDFDDFTKRLALMGLPTVPIISTSFTLNDSIDDLVQYSQGCSILNSQVLREGVVIRPLKEALDLELARGFGNGRVSFKAVNPEYLLKNDT